VLFELTSAQDRGEGTDFPLAPKSIPLINSGSLSVLWKHSLTVTQPTIFGMIITMSTKCNLGGNHCERSVGTIIQLPNPDAIYSRDEEKERKVERHLMFVFAHGPRAAEAR
jgi:hypothetical protein